jgi:hypothetical protein
MVTGEDIRQFKIPLEGKLLVVASDTWRLRFDEKPTGLRTDTLEKGW